MQTLHLIAIWLHLLAAAIWIGGMVFLAAVIIPVLRQPAYRQLLRPLVGEVGRRFRWVGWALLAILVLTGLVNLSYRGFGLTDLASARLWGTSFGKVLVWKAVMVGLMIGAVLLHDLLSVRQARQAEKGNPARQRGADSLRVWSRWLGRVTLLLALVVLFLSVVLVRGWPA